MFMVTSVAALSMPAGQPYLCRAGRPATRRVVDMMFAKAPVFVGQTFPARSSRTIGAGLFKLLG
jgi:hypothetical protein